MQGWEAIEPGLRDRIEKGVSAVMRINRHETFADWLAVGEALGAMQTAAMRLANSNTAAGRGYNTAYQVIAKQVPDLVAIDKATRSHAIWIANNRVEIEAWHGRLPSNIRQQVNHPTTIRRRYDREVGPIGDGTQKSASGKPTLRDEVARLQEELDTERRKLRNVAEGRDYTWHDNPKAIAAALFRLQPTKAKAVAAAILELAKSTTAKPRAARPAADREGGGTLAAVLKRPTD